MIEKAKIMIIDDSDFERALLAQALEKRGYQAISLSSGMNCVENIETENPALAFLDVSMPDIPGNTVLASIREKYNELQFPIIMLTSKSDASDILQSLKLGANDYITKPANFEIAFMRVQTQLKLSELSKEMSRLRELETAAAMIITYNHEINNPLTIARANLDTLLEKDSENKALKKISKAIDRTRDIVKAIEALTEKDQIEYESYSSNSTMVKLK